MTLVELKNISHNFNSKSLGQLIDVSFSVDKGECLSIVGPSGTGKSTLLNIIQGELVCNQGEVFFNEELMIGPSGYKNEVSLEKISYVPQESTLDENLSVFENIKSSLEYVDLEDILKINKVRDMIEIFGLEYKDHKLPSDLSAGQRQRVEFAKAFVNEPELILLDEPFSNLDQLLKIEIINEIFPIFKERNVGVIFVTHNMDEALSISDRMMILAHGKIQQLSSPREIYEAPKSVFVARFTGKANLFASNVLKKEESTFIKNSFGEFKVDLPKELDGKKFIYMGLRPERVSISKDGAHAGRVKSIEYRGDHQLLSIQSIDKNFVLLSIPGHQQVKIGDQVKFDLEVSGAFFLSI